MKKLLLLAACLGLSAFAGETNTVFTMDFETSENYFPGCVEGSNNWVKSYWAVGNGINVVRDPTKAQNGSQYLSCESSNHQTSFNTGTQSNIRLLISGYAKVDSGAGSQFYVKLHAVKDGATPIYDKEVGELTLNPAGGANFSYKGGSFSVSGEDFPADQWGYFGVVVEPATKTILRIQLGTQVKEDEGMLYKSYDHEDCVEVPNGVRVMNSGCLDNFQVATCPLPPAKEFVLVQDQPFDATISQRKLSIINKTVGTFDYKVSVDGNPEWLSIEPMSGTCDGAAELTMTLDRGIMSNGYFRAYITVSGGEYGDKSIIVTAPNGTCHYFENFDPPFMVEGDIEGQGGWRRWTSGAEAEHGMTVEQPDFADNPCAHIFYGGPNEGFARDIYTPDYQIIRFGLDFYKSSQAGEDTGWMHFYNSVWERTFQLVLVRDGGIIRVSKLNDEADYSIFNGVEIPLDQWNHIEATLDYRLQAVTSLTIGDHTEVFPDGIAFCGVSHKNLKNFSNLCIACGNDEQDAMLYLDNVRFDIVERPDECIPSLEGDFTFGESLDQVDAKVVNLGARAFDFSVSFLDYAENLSATPTNGTIESEGNLAVKLNRSGLEDGFHRARMLYAYGDAGSGSLDKAMTNVITFAQGGWYYESNFKGVTYQEGLLNGQDTWKVISAQGETKPSLVPFEGGLVLKFADSGQATTPAQGPAGAKMTFECSFYMEDNANATMIKFGQNGTDGFLPVLVWKDKGSQEAVMGYVPSGTEDMEEWFRAPLGQWNRLSFTIDTDVAVGSATEASLNDSVTNFYEGQVVINPEYDEMPLTGLGLTVQNYGEEEGTETGVYFNYVGAHDSAVPEPAILGLLSLALALIARKRG